MKENVEKLFSVAYTRYIQGEVPKKAISIEQLTVGRGIAIRLVLDKGISAVTGIARTFEGCEEDLILAMIWVVGKTRFSS